MKPYTLSGSSEYRHQDRCFKRVSSDAEWETRIKPIKSGAQWVLHGMGVILFFVTVFAMCFWR